MSVAETSLSHCWHVTVTQGLTAIGQGWTVDKGYSTQRRCRWHVNENKALPEQNRTAVTDRTRIRRRSVLWVESVSEAVQLRHFLYSLDLCSRDLAALWRRTWAQFGRHCVSCFLSSFFKEFTFTAKIHSVLQTSSDCYYVFIQLLH